MSEPIEVELTVNGQRRRAGTTARTTLADFLREECGLTATHLGCEQGVCGACTVSLDGATVLSCLILAVQADGAEIVTAEGLEGPDGALPPPWRMRCRPSTASNVDTARPGSSCAAPSCWPNSPRRPTPTSGPGCAGTCAAAPGTPTS